jgi:translation initiation factor IF-3
VANYKVNKQINAQTVRVIDEDGKQLGIMSLEEALALAEEKDLDLLEVAPNASPPVCRLVDYGKFKYLEQKKEAQAKKKRSIIEVKEIRLRYNTDVGDLETKLKLARKFFEEGNKVKFSMRFRGREKGFVDKGLEKLETIIQSLKDVCIVESQTKELQGNQLILVLSPLKRGK